MSVAGIFNVQSYKNSATTPEAEPETEIETACVTEPQTESETTCETEAKTDVRDSEVEKSDATSSANP
jgi:hypothetical protein